MKEYHYPDFMPKEGELIFVRDSKNHEWRIRAFYKYDRNAHYPWYAQASNGALTVWRYAAPYFVVPRLVLYAEEDQPMPGQPILVRDTPEGDWVCRIFSYYEKGASNPWRTGRNIGYRYAAHYDEQFWLAQQKKEEEPKEEEPKEEEPVDAHKQAEKLADFLTNLCNAAQCVLPRRMLCPSKANHCSKITKDDWLAWAAKQEN